MNIDQVSRKAFETGARIRPVGADYCYMLRMDPTKQFPDHYYLEKDGLLTPAFPLGEYEPEGTDWEVVE